MQKTGKAYVSLERIMPSVKVREDVIRNGLTVRRRSCTEQERLWLGGGHVLTCTTLILLVVLSGHLEDVPEYLKKSEEFVGTRAALEPGLNFCKVMKMWIVKDGERDWVTR